MWTMLVSLEGLVVVLLVVVLLVVEVMFVVGKGSKECLCER